MSSRALDDPVLEERRLAALAHIRQLGDPVLRSPAEEVTVFDDTLRAEAERMAVIMHDARGVGLAAPQIGRLSRLIVVSAGDEGAVTALCNPRIVWRSEEEEIDAEGCLSIGEVTVEVARSVEIRIEAQALDGEAVEVQAEGFEARVLQHEIDHVEGILILDRATPAERREAMRQLRGGS